MDIHDVVHDHECLVRGRSTDRRRCSRQYRKIIDSLGSGLVYDRSTITANISLSVLALAVALGFYQTFLFSSLFWAWHAADIAA